MAQFLKLIGMAAAPFTDDDILNAENENDLHDHSKALEAAKCAIADRDESSQKLRGALEEHKTRTEEFALFERRLRMEQEDVRRNV